MSSLNNVTCNYLFALKLELPIDMKQIKLYLNVVSCIVDINKGCTCSEVVLCKVKLHNEAIMLVSRM